MKYANLGMELNMHKCGGKGCTKYKMWKNSQLAAQKETEAMEKPVLVIMAAGMGSRYGGLKQIDPVGPQGQIILDYSVYDA